MKKEVGYPICIVLGVVLAVLFVLLGVVLYTTN